MIETTGASPAHLSVDNAAKRLAERAGLLARIRGYFQTQQVMEVETPLLSRFAVTDPQLDNIRVENPFVRSRAGRIDSIDKNNPNDDWLYLTTSPEYAMKQLLSLGSGSIYQLGKAFRQDPPGRLHSSEFTMLEWYRLGFDMDALIDDVVALINTVIESPALPVEKLSYREVFLTYLQIDPLVATAKELENIARLKLDVSFSDQDKDIWLDLLLSHCIEPHLGQGCMTFLYDYPASQAALARLAEDQYCNVIAKRFELYINGVELANGYHELTDLQEQLQRFEADNNKRLTMGKSTRDIDSGLSQALERGLPECAGVALGVDRLMLVVGREIVLRESE